MHRFSCQFWILKFSDLDIQKVIFGLEIIEINMKKGSMYLGVRYNKNELLLFEKENETCHPVGIFHLTNC